MQHRKNVDSIRFRNNIRLNRPVVQKQRSPFVWLQKENNPHKMKISIPNFQASATSLMICFCVALTAFAQESKREEPTQAEFGKFTTKEHLYSELYKKGQRDGPGLRSVVEQVKTRGEHYVGLSSTACFTILKAPSVTAEEFLRTRACKADAVLLGSAKRTGAHMVDDETNIYTAYDFSVEEIFKNNPANPIEAGQKIEITRPGGTILLDGVTISISDNIYEALRSSGDYILFLTYVPAANGYMVSGSEGDFLIYGHSYKKLGEAPTYSKLSPTGDTSDLLTALRNAVSLGCDNGLKGVKETK